MSFEVMVRGALSCEVIALMSGTAFSMCPGRQWKPWKNRWCCVGEYFFVGLWSWLTGHPLALGTEEGKGDRREGQCHSFPAEIMPRPLLPSGLFSAYKSPGWVLAGERAVVSQPNSRLMSLPHNCRGLSLEWSDMLV